MGSKVFFKLCLFLSASVLAAAQTISTSQIRGVIQDSSGAAVAGANIRLTQTATGAVRVTTSAADGGYALPDLSVGSYDLEVTKEGLALREIAPGVTVDEVKAATGCNLIIPREVPPVRTVA